MAADAFEQFALAALLALLAGRDAGFVGKHFVAGLIQVNNEFFPKLFYRFTPVELAFFDFIEFFFEARRERHVEDVFETFYEQNADSLAKHRWEKTPLLFANVFAFDERGNNVRVCGRAADAVFFQFFHQRRIVETRRRLREMLFGADFIEPQKLAFGHTRQRLAFALVVLFVVFAIGIRRGQLIHAQVAVEFLDRAGRAEGVIASRNIDRGLVEDRRKHLRSDEPLPDQLIELE